MENSRSQLNSLKIIKIGFIFTCIFMCSWIVLLDLWVRPGKKIVVEKFNKDLSIASIEKNGAVEIDYIKSDLNKNEPVIDISKIQLVSVAEKIHLDPNKSAIFFVAAKKFILTTLYLTNSLNFVASLIQRGNLKLKIISETRVLFHDKVDLLKYRIYSNSFYSSYALTIDLNNFRVNESTSGWLKYHLIVDNVESPEFAAPIISDHHMTEDNNRTARLIKCIWKPSDVPLFEHVMQLIAECRYDAIYVCVFSADHELKALLNKTNTRGLIRIIELENLPNFQKPGEDFHMFEEGFELQPQSRGEMFDPSLEFLLNQVYPFLVNKFRYVHAADFDHIVFTHNLTMFERMQEVVQKNKVAPHVSLYFNQYWALDNNMTRKIFQNVEGLLAAKSIDLAESIEAIRARLEEFQYPIVLETAGVGFELKIDNKEGLLYAVKIVKRLNMTEENDFIRRVVFKFRQSNIYGQTVHNTKSSMLIKLCAAGMVFPNGQSVVAESPHSIHFRETYDFSLLKVNNRFIPVDSFVFTSELD